MPPRVPARPSLSPSSPAAAAQRASSSGASDAESSSGMSLKDRMARLSGGRGGGGIPLPGMMGSPPSFGGGASSTSASPPTADSSTLGTEAAEQKLEHVSLERVTTSATKKRPQSKRMQFKLDEE